MLKIIEIGCLLGIVLLSGACTSVAAYDKGNLARPEMAIGVQNNVEKFREHTYSSKEGGGGGGGVAGGGCGCN